MTSTCGRREIRAALKTHRCRGPAFWLQRQRSKRAARSRYLSKTQPCARSGSLRARFTPGSCVYTARCGRERTRSVAQAEPARAHARPSPGDGFRASGAKRSHRLGARADMCRVSPPRSASPRGVETIADRSTQLRRDPARKRFPRRACEGGGSIAPRGSARSRIRSLRPSAMSAQRCSLCWLALSESRIEAHGRRRRFGPPEPASGVGVRRRGTRFSTPRFLRSCVVLSSSTHRRFSRAASKPHIVQ